MRVTVGGQELRLLADRTFYRQVCPWNTKVGGMVFARLEKLDGTPYELCGRSQLRRACQDLKQHFGYDLRCGFELKFKLLKHGSVSVQHGLQEIQRPALENVESNTVSDSAYSLLAHEEDFLAIIHQLSLAGVEVETIAKDTYLSGQFRLTLPKHEEVLKAIDDYYLVRMLLKKHFEKKGLIVSFLPTTADMAGHVNAVVSLSLWKEKNVSGDEFSLYGMSEAFQSFTAGLLGHFPALLNYLQPHNTSLRLQKSGFAVKGAYQCWTLNNAVDPLLAPIRAVQTSPAQAHKQQTNSGKVSYLDLQHH